MFLTKKQNICIFLGLFFWYLFGISLLVLFIKDVLYEDFVKYNVIYFIHAGMIFGSIVSFLGSKKLSNQGSVGKSLLFIGFGLLANAFGFFAWFISETILRQVDLYPAPADFFFVLFYPLVSIGLIYLLRVYALNLTKFKLIQALFFAIFSGLIMFFVFDLSFPSFDESDSFLKSFFDLMYTFTDVLLVSVVILALRLAGGKIFKGLFVFLFGLILNVVADLVFFYRIENGIYYTGDIGDLFYALSGIALAIGAYFVAKNFTFSYSGNYN